MKNRMVHNTVEPTSIEEDVEVLVMGDHPKSGRYDFIHNIGDLD